MGAWRLGILLWRRMISESDVTQVVILVAIALYVYILAGPTRTRVPKYSPFILEDFTQAQFDEFLGQVRGYGEGGSSSSNGGGSSGDAYGGGSGDTGTGTGMQGFKGGPRDDDDFFFKGQGATQGGVGEGGWAGQNEFPNEPRTPPPPLVPSSDFYCRRGWVSFRSELNYKFLWMHDKDTTWMSATAPLDTGLHHRAFETIPVGQNCSAEGGGAGWVKLRAHDHSGFVAMNGPATNSDSTWVVQVKSEDEHTADNNVDYHFLLEKDGYLVNKGAMAMVNVINNPDFPVRGHGSDYYFERVAAGRESTAQYQYQFLNASDVVAAEEHQQEEDSESAEEDANLKKMIAGLPTSTEKRVIAFGLYGRNPKYTTGAIRNMELVPSYFPGWTCRFYMTSDVPAEVREKLTAMGAEIIDIPDGLGYVAGMFWRFLVAADSTVDRYIIRDSDSRLNARDAIAVQEWVLSQRKVHIQRDHVNHCIPMNGGMWGGTKDAVPNMVELINDWPNKDEYGVDLHFLEMVIYPLVQHDALAHDSYCCDRFQGSRPFPSKRFPNYQHVGQVFDSKDVARLTDIDGFIRGVPIPSSCRKHAEWIYG